MSTTRITAEDSRNRFFHAMVLMGGSLALGCGGATTHDGASGGTSAGGAPGSGGLPSSGGASAGGAGGSIIVSLGGSATVGPFDCPPAQWDCSATPPECHIQAYALPSHCACDPKRPLAPADCPAGTDWVCRVAGFDSNYRNIDELPFECSCVEHQMACGLACDKLFENAGRCYTPSGADNNSILCDCALIILR